MPAGLCGFARAKIGCPPYSALSFIDQALEQQQREKEEEEERESYWHGKRKGEKHPRSPEQKRRDVLDPTHNHKLVRLRLELARKIPSKRVAQAPPQPPLAPLVLPPPPSPPRTLPRPPALPKGGKPGSAKRSTAPGAVVVLQRDVPPAHSGLAMIKPRSVTSSSTPKPGSAGAAESPSSRPAAATPAQVASKGASPTMTTLSDSKTAPVSSHVRRRKPSLPSLGGEATRADIAQTPPMPRRGTATNRVMPPQEPVIPPPCERVAEPDADVIASTEAEQSAKAGMPPAEVGSQSLLFCSPTLPPPLPTSCQIAAAALEFLGSATPVITTPGACMAAISLLRARREMALAVDCEGVALSRTGRICLVQVDSAHGEERSEIWER